MIMPVRCFSCGKPIAHLWEKYQSDIEKGTPAAKALDKAGLDRYCCRRMFVSHRDYLDEIIKYKWR